MTEITDGMLEALRAEDLHYKKKQTNSSATKRTKKPKHRFPVLHNVDLDGKSIGPLRRRGPITRRNSRIK